MRVRFAPSPTGKLHVGNIRTALVNALIAKKSGGAFVLRMEDTDLEREVPEAEAKMLADFAWLGMTPDEHPLTQGPFAPYRTRERAANGDYNKALQHLFDTGRAYECFVSKDELDLMRKIQTSQGQPPHYDNRHRDLSDSEKQAFRAEGRQPVIRFKLNDGPILWDDMVRGTVRYEAKNLGGDPVIVRATGVPLFALAGAVDDINQNITHIIRGEDHVTNTAIQIQIFEALGATPPVMAHMPMLLDADGGKLSKRLDSLSIDQLRSEGYLPQALLTYLCSLGFSSLPEAGELAKLASQFDLSNMGRAPVRFDTQQMRRINASVIHNSRYTEIKPYLAEFLSSSEAEETLSAFWEAVKDNIEVLTDLQPLHDLCFGEVAGTASPEDQEYLAAALAALPTGDYSADTWSQWTAALKAETGRKGKGLFMPLRKALTGAERGPEMAGLVAVMGEATVKKRLSAAIH